jgi:hypothetical protein
MQGDVSTDDFILGSIILVIFLVSVYAAGRALSRIKNARFARAWQPLVPVIGGKVIDDGGGAASSWLTGTYKGRSFAAQMVPGRNRYSGETGFRYNYFDVALLETPGKADWSLDGRPISRDKSLEQRLMNAGAMDVLTGIGSAEVRYDARQRTLTIVQEPGAAWVPPPAHFEAQLNALLRLAEINAAVN